MKNEFVFLKHIISSIENIESFCKEKEEFMKSIMIQHAIIKDLEIIGEASKNIPTQFKNKYPSIEWKKIAGLRDKLTHNYFGIDLDLVWNIVKTKLPELKKEINNILNKT
jgi:uncharacterized protein with HEPN domain